MGRVTHADTQRMMAWLLANRKEPYFTVTVQSASAPFNYSFTPYITLGQSFWVDWGDGSEETFTTASTAEKSHEYSTPGTKTIRMLGSAGINRVRISPTNAGQAALIIGSNGNLDKLGTITNTADMFRACPNLVMTELTGGITSIDNTMFYGCTNLALTSLPEDVTSIGTNAFYGCTNLALASLPEDVTSIGESAFNNCTKLALTSLPEGVTSIGTNTFRNCKGLTNLIFLGTPTSIASNAFTGSGANLYVPWSSGAVAGAPWGAASVTYDYTP